MNIGVVAVLAVIFATTAFSAWRKLSFSIIVSTACVAVFAVMHLAAPGNPDGIMNQLWFMPRDLTDPSYAYTILTSMYTHANILHLLFNILGLFFIGLIFEQRIGTRPFMLLYFIAGICGTLTFAAIRWGQPLTAVVGASGAISGVLGGFARLYPKERMSMLLFFFPLPPMPIWIVVAIFVFIQLLFVGGSSGIAVEGHIGGLVAGILVAPLVARLSSAPRMERASRRIPVGTFKRMATTPELKAILELIEKEEIPDVRNAWADKFLAEARCPHCGAKLKMQRGGVMCERGHII